MATSPLDALELEVASFSSEAKDVVVLELRERSGGALPAFTPGSHLEVNLPGGLVRHYSLCNDPCETDRYCLGVALSKDSRGGSRHLHQSVRRGDRLVVSAPRNNFPLVADAQAYAFIAGGIGITPLLSMIKWCRANGKPWRLHYCVRSRQRAAFYEELRALGTPEQLRFHFDDEQAGRLFDPGNALRELPAAAHVYCCGPAPLMNAVKEAARDRPAAHLHFEWFVPKPAPPAPAGTFAVVIRSTGQRLRVAPEQTILDVLEAHGVSLPASCREGLCATCQTTVLCGIPDHRDSVLTQEQRESNRTMLVCVSRAKSQELVLDL